MRTPLFAALLVLAGAEQACADEPRWPKFDNLPADAEVHAVTISEPLFSGVEADEITDWQGLVKALRSKDGPGAHICKRLPEGSEKVVNEQAEMGKLEEGIDLRIVPGLARLRLSNALTQAMWVKSFYDKDVFAGVELPKRAKELIELGDKRTVYQNELLNRELLAAAFPGCIAPTPADFHITRVTVNAGAPKVGKPVVLVLSCSYQCRWEVKVEKEATIAGVVLFGSGPRN